MNRDYLKRIAGEFLIIVLGVLVALAVDDWRAVRATRSLEASLLSRLQAELVADGADLAQADLTIRRRLWVVDALLAELGDEAASDRLLSERLDSLVNPERVDSLRMENGQGPMGGFDPVSDPLSPFRSLPEFDLSDDVYQEMLATGTLTAIRDRDLRASIFKYYRWAEDQGGNEKRAGEYQTRLEEALSWVDVTLADPISFRELVRKAAEDSRLPTELRRAMGRMRLQTRRYFPNIEEARVSLEEMVAEYLGSR